MKIAYLACFTIALASAGFVQAAPETPPEMAAVTANDRAYEAAYNKGDSKALADFFAEDADYTTDEGRVFSGRETIGNTIKAGLLVHRGSKLTIVADVVRALSPDTVLEKGSTTVTAKNGEKTTALFNAIHVKKDGKWKISQLIESPVPTLTPREHLAELEWLIGNWADADKADDLSVSSSYTWARGGNFLSRSITVKRGGNVTLEGRQIIGWDPVEEQLRSWTFDGDGGFSEGLFTRDGDRWLLRETGVTPDGSRTSGDNTITKVSADKYTWESNNRTLDGDPLPSISRIEISRVKGN